MPFDRRTVWFLTENEHKFQEARSILGSYKIPIHRLRGAKLEIQSPSLEKIARFAIERAVKDHNRLMFIEDSGLFIDALGGFPGPFSSYVYDTIGLKGILNLLDGRKRGAFFQCSIAIASSGVRFKLFTGIVNGRISRQIAGHGGFGYDPIFIPHNSNKTFGESGKEFKNKYSHRALALHKFAKWFDQASANKSLRNVNGALK